MWRQNGLNMRKKTIWNLHMKSKNKSKVGYMLYLKMCTKLKQQIANKMAIMVQSIEPCAA